MLIKSQLTKWLVARQSPSAANLQEPWHSDRSPSSTSPPLLDSPSQACVHALALARKHTRTHTHTDLSRKMLSSLENLSKDNIFTFWNLSTFQWNNWIPISTLREKTHHFISPTNAHRAFNQLLSVSVLNMIGLQIITSHSRK